MMCMKWNLIGRYEMHFCFPANMLALKPKANYYRLVRENTSWFHNTCQGFSLLEVLISLCIIAIVLTSVYRLQAQSLDLYGIIRFQTIAPLLAEMKLAEIEADQPDPPDVDSGVFEEISSDLIWDSSVEEVEGFVDSQGQPTLIRITVIVRQQKTGDIYTVQTCRSFPSL